VGFSGRQPNGEATAVRVLLLVIHLGDGAPAAAPEHPQGAFRVAGASVGLDEEGGLS